MKEYKIYAAGEFHVSKDVLSVNNPHNNEQIAKTYLADAALLEKTIVKAISLEKDLREMPAFVRYDILMQIAEVIRSRKDELALVLSKEAGNP